MNIFKFTKLRKKLFIGFSILFIGIPLLSLILVNIGIPHGIWEEIISIICFFWWIPSIYLADFLGLKAFLSMSNVRYTDILLALLISTIFYFILAFLLSWIGNLKKDSKP